MNKIKSSVNSDADKNNTFSKLRNTIFCKIIQMWLYHITRSNTLEIFDDSINSLTTVSSNQTLHIFCNKSLWFLGVNKLCKMSEQTTTSSIQSRLFPDNREILTWKTTQNNITFRNRIVRVRINFRNVFIMNYIAEICRKRLTSPFGKIISPYCFISFHMETVIQPSTA